MTHSANDFSFKMKIYIGKFNDCFAIGGLVIVRAVRRIART